MKLATITLAPKYCSQHTQEELQDEFDALEQSFKVMVPAHLTKNETDDFMQQIGEAYKEALESNPFEYRGSEDHLDYSFVWEYVKSTANV